MALPFEWYEILNPVLEKLMRWSTEGRALPGYRYGDGTSFLAALLNISKEMEKARNKPHTTLGFTAEMVIANRNTLIALAGPHGWALLQMLIIKAKEREAANGRTITLGNYSRTRKRGSAL